MMWFLSGLWFLPNLWFLGELVVLGRACGSWASLWFLGVFVVFAELVVLGRTCGFLASLWISRSRASNANRRLLWIRSSAQATRKRVVFAELVVLACGFWIARSALRVRNGKSRQKPRARAVGFFDAYPVRIDEDALEGLYFAFSLILRCLPYFCRKTRPRASHELLEAFLPSCGECGARSISHLPPTHTP